LTEASHSGAANAPNPESRGYYFEISGSRCARPLPGDEEGRLDDPGERFIQDGEIEIHAGRKTVNADGSN